MQSTESVAALDIVANRASRKYSRAEMVKRVMWGFGCMLVRISPRPFFAWRRFVLRCFGARVGKGVHIYPSTTVYMPWNLSIGDLSAIGEGALIYNLGHVTIGRSATISHGAQLCAGTHDYTRRDMPLLKLPIRVDDQAWICTEAFVGPGVHVGEGAVVAARAVAVKDVSAWTVVAGNPARIVKQRVVKA